MTGLLIKDGYTMLRQSKFFLLMVVVLAFLPSDYIFSYAMFYSALLVTTTLAYDERAKWDSLVNMFPYTEKQIVGSKYILGYLMIAATMVLCILGKYVNALILGRAVTSAELLLILIVVCIATIIEAITLPFAISIGIEKGRLIFVLFCVISIVSTTSFIENLNFAQIQINMKQIVAAVLGITAAVNLISYQAAKLLYRRKKA